MLLVPRYSPLHIQLLSPIGPRRRAGGLSGPRTDAPHDAQATRRRDPLGRPARLTDGTRDQAHQTELSLARPGRADVHGARRVWAGDRGGSRVHRSTGVVSGPIADSATSPLRSGRLDPGHRNAKPNPDATPVAYRAAQTSGRALRPTD